jgi:hypothetical protein
MPVVRKIKTVSECVTTINNFICARTPPYKIREKFLESLPGKLDIFRVLCFLSVFLLFCFKHVHMMKRNITTS